MLISVTNALITEPVNKTETRWTMWDNAAEPTVD